MESGSVDLILTDPPFGQNLGYGRGRLGERFIEGDDNLDWLPETAKELYRILRADKACLVFCQWRTYTKFEKQFTDVGFTVRSVAILGKGRLVYRVGALQNNMNR